MQEKKAKVSNFFERISKIIDFYGINSVNSFACDYLGYASSEKINRLKKENTYPSYEILNDISNKFEDVNPEWLLTGRGMMFRKKEDSPLVLNNPHTVYGNLTNENTRKIPIIDIEAAAGSGQLNGDYIEPLGFIAVPINSLHSRTATYYAIRSRGDSMFPTIYDKDILIIRQLHRGEWGELRDEYVYVIVDRNGKAYVKRIKDRLSRGFIVLTSDNLDKINYPNFTLEESELHYFFYAELKISAHFPNINATYFDRLKSLEDRFDEMDFRFKKLEK